MRRPLIALLILSLVVAPLPVLALDSPNFRTTVPEPELVPGSTQQLTILLENDAVDPDESADLAGDVEVTVNGTGPVEVASGPRLVGDMADGAVREVTVRVDVAADAEAGRYRLPLEVSYVDDGERETTTVFAAVRVDERARFEVESVASEAPIGQRGTVTLNVTNVGSAPASAAAVTVTSGSPDVTFGRSASTTRFVGSWAPGETKTITVETTVAETAENRSYSLQATVQYDDTDGATRQSRPLRFGITPAPEQSFAIRDVESTLEVGEEGTLTGTVVNTGDRSVEGVVVQLVSTDPNVDPIETEVAVGSLAPGETATFTLDAAVSSAADAGDRLVQFRVRYRDAADDVAVSEPKDARVAVAAASDEFDVAPVSATFRAGEDGQLEVEITNTREVTLTDVSAKLFADAPLSSDDDEAFVAALAPGETATLTFGLAVDGSAIAKVYPVELDFRYDTPDGDTRISDTYQVPVSVTDDGGGGLSLGLLGGVAVVVVIVAGFLVAYRRR